MQILRRLTALGCALIWLLPAVSPAAQVKSLQVTVLSTMLADDGVGEWGFAALVEADGHRLLFDTGARPDTVLNNARELGIDLSQVDQVVLSHNHGDHTGGLLRLRREVLKRRQAALSLVNVGPGIFWQRPSKDEGERNPMIALRSAYTATGGKFIEHPEPAEILPGVWLTGPIQRRYPEHNYGPPGLVQTPGGLVQDTIPEDQALVLDTDRGLVVLTGCGHAGISNTLAHARHVVRDAPIHAALGGFHLYSLPEDKLRWTAERLRELGTQHILGAHCTGIEAVYRLRELVGLSRKTCVVGAVGSRFRLSDGIDPRRLAR